MKDVPAAKYAATLGSMRKDCRERWNLLGTALSQAQFPMTMLQCLNWLISRNG
jgi:hypothetical protein